MQMLAACTGFEWDSGNRDKHWQRHRVSPAECEQVFFSEPLVVAHDAMHSGHEPRYYALGRTNGGRRLFLVVTLRGKLIRVISARDVSRRERREYEHARHKAEESTDIPD